MRRAARLPAERTGNGRAEDAARHGFPASAPGTAGPRTPHATASRRAHRERPGRGRRTLRLPGERTGNGRAEDAARYGFPRSARRNGRSGGRSAARFPAERTGNRPAGARRAARLPGERTGNHRGGGAARHGFPRSARGTAGPRTRRGAASRRAHGEPPGRERGTAPLPGERSSGGRA